LIEGGDAEALIRMAQQAASALNTVAVKSVDCFASVESGKSLRSG
jgi:hypothetical protein